VTTKGDLKAREMAVFGIVLGDIKTAGICIDDGAYFKGSIDIVRPEPRQAKTTVLSEPAMAGD
jgi:cytoskeletal protein CcmA (bactofilin family)